MITNDVPVLEKFEEAHPGYRKYNVQVPRQKHPLPL